MWSDKTIEEAKKVGMISTGTVTPEQMEAFKKAWEEHILPKVRFVRTSSLAVLPARGTEGAVGYDVFAAEHKVLFAGSSLPVLIDTGWKIAVQDGYEVQVRPRSGLALKKGVTVLNTPGTIDPDYRGTLGVILINHSLENFEVKPGDRIAQLVVAPVTRAAMIEVESFDDTTARGEGGFGSSGV